MRLITAPMIAIITIIGFSVTLSGCESSYRYPCQDPANWDKPECNNEACRADGTCSKDTLGPNFFRDKKEEEAVVTEPTESEPSIEPSISNDKPELEKPKAIVMDPEGDEYEPPARTPQSMEPEEPVTMNTIVDTAAHNAATK